VTDYFGWHGLDYKKFFNNFSSALIDELNFKHEAQNSKKTAEMLKDD